MRELYIIRHGAAGKSVEDESKDQNRRLTKRGKEKVKSIAKNLHKREIAFDVVITSPLPRAKETAEIISAHCSTKSEPYPIDLLKPGASNQKLVSFLNQIRKAEKVAIVGHEPFLSDFVSFCLSKSDHSFITLKKGGVVMLEIDEIVKPGKCKLSWLSQPDHIVN